MEKMGEEVRDGSNPDLSFGSAIGAGVQKLLIGGTLEEAWLETFLNWDCDIEEKYEKAKKSLAYALHAVKTFEAYARILLEDWEVYEFLAKDGNVRKATELSARIDFPNGFVYRLYIDVVLRSKSSGKLLVLELKTTKFKVIDESLYKNSNQALGYGVVVDAIAPGEAEFDVWYYPYSSTEEDWKFFPFPKSRIAKAEWIKTVLHDTRVLNLCIEEDFFPKNGENCYDFFRQCDYYGACDMSKRARYAGPATLESRVKKKSEDIYDFNFTVEQLIAQQMQDIEGA